MDITEISEKIKKVVDGYSKTFDKSFTPDQEVLKLHEEAGEFTKAYLKYKGVGRNKAEKSKEELHMDMSDELADLVGMCLFLAKRNDIDIEESLERKWFKWLKE